MRGTCAPCSAAQLLRRRWAAQSSAVAGRRAGPGAALMHAPAPIDMGPRCARSTQACRLCCPWHGSLPRTLLTLATLPWRFPWQSANLAGFQWATLDENQACGLCYTSGTTGPPKVPVRHHKPERGPSVAALLFKGHCHPTAASLGRKQPQAQAPTLLLLLLLRCASSCAVCPLQGSMRGPAPASSPWRSSSIGRSKGAALHASAVYPRRLLPPSPDIGPAAPAAPRPAATACRPLSQAVQRPQRTPLPKPHRACSTPTEPTFCTPSSLPCPTRSTCAAPAACWLWSPCSM